MNFNLKYSIFSTAAIIFIAGSAVIADTQLRGAGGDTHGLSDGGDDSFDVDGPFDWSASVSDFIAASKSFEASASDFIAASKSFEDDTQLHGAGAGAGAGAKKKGKNSKSSKNSKNSNKNEVIELIAVIDNEGFKGTVSVKQRQSNREGEQITDAIWVVDIEEINEDICVDVCGDNCDEPATALDWHIHEKAIPDADGTCYDTGGHWDPTFGCGGASQFANVGGFCETIARQIDGREVVQTCDPNADIAKCELGDLSGKVGQTQIKVGTQQFSDKYISNLDNIKDLSIVFHCGVPRVACGNLETVTN
jgi:hypothetical protein